MDNVFERYKRLREVGKRLNVKLIKEFAGSAMKKCGKDLGMFKRGILVFNSDDETSILMDFCIHNHRVNKKTVIDQYLEKSNLDPISDEMLILKSLQSSFFSVFVVDGTEQGHLCHLKDIVHQRELTVIDSGLGQTAKPGMLLASRLMQIPSE